MRENMSMFYDFTIFNQIFKNITYFIIPYYIIILYVNTYLQIGID